MQEIKIKKYITAPLKLYRSMILNKLGDYVDYTKKIPFIINPGDYNPKMVKNYFSNTNKTGFIVSIDYLVRPGISNTEKLSDYVEFEYVNSLPFNITYPSNMRLEVMDGNCPSGFYRSERRFDKIELTNPCNGILLSLNGLIFMVGIVAPMAAGVFLEFWSAAAVIPAIISGIKIGYDSYSCNAYEHPLFSYNDYFEEVKVCLLDTDSQNVTQNKIKEANFQLKSLLSLQLDSFALQLKKTCYSCEEKPPFKVEKYKGGINKYFKDDSKPGFVNSVYDDYLEVMYGTCPSRYKLKESQFQLTHEESQAPCHYEYYELGKLIPTVGLLASYLLVKEACNSLLIALVYIPMFGILHHKSTKCKESENTGQEPIQIKYFEEVKYCIPDVEPNVLVQSTDYSE